MNYQYLTQKEELFFNALKKENELNQEKSFLNLLFCATLKSENQLRKELVNLFENHYQEIFIKSDILFESIDCIYIGKYECTYWATNSEGELFGVGQEIQNIAFFILNSFFGDVLEEKEKINHYFKKSLNLDYESYIIQYTDFCQSLGLIYKEDFVLIENQSKEFNKQINEWKK